MDTKTLCLKAARMLALTLSIAAPLGAGPMIDGAMAAPGPAAGEVTIGGNVAHTVTSGKTSTATVDGATVGAAQAITVGGSTAATSTKNAVLVLDAHPASTTGAVGITGGTADSADGGSAAITTDQNFKSGNLTITAGNSNAGNAGGNASFISNNGTVTTTTLEITGGNAGAGTGAGGNAAFTSKGAVSTGGKDLLLLGGAASATGNGGNASFTSGGNVTAGNISLLVGDGNPAPHKGGDVTFESNGNVTANRISIDGRSSNLGTSTKDTITSFKAKNVTSSADIDVLGGHGKTSFTADNVNAGTHDINVWGYAAGTTSFTAKGNVTAGTVTVLDGDDGSTTSFNVGGALNASTLYIDDTTINADGAVNLNIGKLDLIRNDTTFFVNGFDGDASNSKATFNHIVLGGGKNYGVDAGTNTTLNNLIPNDKIFINNLEIARGGAARRSGANTWATWNDSFNTSPTVRNLNFNLTGVLPGDTMLKLAPGQNAELYNKTVVGLTGSSAGFTNIGQRVNLIDASGEGSAMNFYSGVGAPAAKSEINSTAMVNGKIFALDYTGGNASGARNTLTATLTAYSEAYKALTESAAASLAATSQGTDLIAGPGVSAALASSQGRGMKVSGFSAMSGGTGRYDTGSHVDVNAFSLLLGAAWGDDVGSGRLTLGAFFEGGIGDYSTYNSFSRDSVKGDGSTNYVGGGVLARYDLPVGLYFDASARMGNAQFDFSSGDMDRMVFATEKSNFDSSAMYYGLHGGIGYIANFSEDVSLDLSGKLFWTHAGSDTVTVNENRVKFEDADSLRTRLGARLNIAANETVTPYVGAAWEHEFDGKAQTTINGYKLSDPAKLEGSTGIGELGIIIKPSDKYDVSVNIGAQGYLGTREGASGSLEVKWDF